MRRTMALGATVVLAAVAVAGWALAGDGKARGHDFGEAGGDTCAICHVTHRAEPPEAAPLWNPNADLSRRFGSAGVTGKRSAPGIGTTSCLRCHDGTVTDRVGTGRPTARYKTKYALARRSHGESNHPVGVDYPRFGKGYWPLNLVLSRGTVRLPNNKIECTSCHDPHNEAGLDQMLVMSDARSALCLTCHRK